MVDTEDDDELDANAVVAAAVLLADEDEAEPTEVVKLRERIFSVIISFSQSKMKKKDEW